MRLLTCHLLAAASLAADAFDGRWILPVAGDPRGRVWWLEVNGGQGEFVGAPGGQVDPVTQFTRAGGELTWQIKDNRYRARLDGARLVGQEETGARRAFAGVKAPAIKDVDDGKWIKQTPVELFNGRDLAGWRLTAPNRSLAEWQTDGGAMTNGKGKAPDIASEQKFWNFDLHLEFRVGHHSNSGVGLRGRYEIQIYGDHGEPPSAHGNGALYSRIVPAVNATLSPDAWQTFDIRFIGRHVTVKLNGKTLIDKQEVKGYTAMATDANEDQPGPIALQGDHGPVAFRKVTVTPLTRK